MGYRTAAEGVGFEPTVRRTYNGFRDRPIRPLSHPSGRRGYPNRRPVMDGSGITRLAAIREELGEERAQRSAENPGRDRHAS